MDLSTQTLIFLGGSQVWIMKLVALVIGYKIVRLGSGLLRDGITGEFEFQSEFHGAKADLVSASPGLLFVLIGGLIVCYALFVDKNVDFGSSEEAIEEATSTVSAIPNGDEPPEVDLAPVTEEVTP